MNKLEFKEYLNKIVEKNKIFHSYLFYGEEIEEFNNEILLFLNNIALSEISELEKKANIKKQINTGIIQDFKHIDGKESKIDDVRKMFMQIYEKPFLLNKKIYIIDNFEYLNVNSQNAMLKILEEPPTYVCIILKAKTISNILDTIKSRCQKIFLKTNKLDIEIKSEIDSKQIAIKNFILDINTMDKAEYYGKYSKVIKKENILEFCNYLEKIIESDVLQYYKYTDLILDVKNKINGNVNFEMIKDYLILKMYES